MSAPGIFRTGLTLAIIGAVCTTLVAATYQATKDRIAANDKALLEQSLAPALSGIFFDISAVPGWLGDLLALNPMAHFITAYRAVILDGMFPDWPVLVIVSVTGLLGLAAGLTLLHRYDKLYPRLV